MILVEISKHITRTRSKYSVFSRPILENGGLVECLEKGRTRLEEIQERSECFKQTVTVYVFAENAETASNLRKDLVVENNEKNTHLDKREYQGTLAENQVEKQDFDINEATDDKQNVTTMHWKRSSDATTWSEFLNETSGLSEFHCHVAVILVC